MFNFAMELSDAAVFLIAFFRQPVAILFGEVAFLQLSVQFGLPCFCFLTFCFESLQLLLVLFLSLGPLGFLLIRLGQVEHVNVAPHAAFGCENA